MGTGSGCPVADPPGRADRSHQTLRRVRAFSRAMGWLGRPTGIRAVLFDLGGTLVDERHPEFWAEVAQSIGLTVDPEVLAQSFNELEVEVDNAPEPCGREEFWQRVLSRAWGGAIEPSRVSRFCSSAWDRRTEAPPLLFSDVPWCLHELERKQLALGVVSNSRSESSVREILEGVGLGSRFRIVVSSGSEGVAKPDPEIFRRALARLSLRPPEAFYVGNLRNTDARAALRAGLSAVWLNRGGTGFGEDPPEVTSLSEVPLAVAGAGRVR
jgi:putative hydrolase of the HAD superfamily